MTGAGVALVGLVHGGVVPGGGWYMARAWWGVLPEGGSTWVKVVPGKRSSLAGVVPDGSWCLAGLVPGRSALWRDPEGDPGHDDNEDGGDVCGEEEEPWVPLHGEDGGQAGEGSCTMKAKE
jgi:hypothetical protein